MKQPETFWLKNRFVITSQALSAKLESFAQPPFCSPSKYSTQTICFDMESLGKPLRHVWCEPAFSSFIITDHVLADTHFLGELGLCQARFEPGCSQEIAYTIGLHFLPKISLLNRHAVGLVGSEYAHFKLLADPCDELISMLTMYRQLNIGLFTSFGSFFNPRLTLLLILT